MFDFDYPEAALIPWVYDGGKGYAYYRNSNKPIAVVIHIAQGWKTTSREWARTGYTDASFHFQVDRAGATDQYMNLGDGGYHCGIKASAPRPTWKLWRGYAINTNYYTVGIEHDGFSGQEFPEAQLRASAKLCAWVLTQIGQPADRDHVIGHYEIDSVNRPNDPGPTFPWDRYMTLVQASMKEVNVASTEEVEKLQAQINGLQSQVAELMADMAQLRTQAWGAQADGSAPKRRSNKNGEGYADANMFDVERLMKANPMLTRAEAMSHGAFDIVGGTLVPKDSRMTDYVYADRVNRFPEGTVLQYRFMDNDTVDVAAMLGPVDGSELLTTLEFQAGPIPEHGVNGLTNELLIDILVERIGRLNKMFPCRENSLAITKLEEANHWLHARTARRKAMGIEGTHEERP
jgi:N-acetyl-anhydromuramyl-L-alanine amidase AmpD